jgi:hypothetical protein
MTDLLEWMAATPGADAAAVRQRLRDWLSRSARPLADQWWHAGDLDEAYAWAVRRLGEVGVAPPSEEAFVARHAFIAEHVEDEEEQRRHQLGFVAAHANARLEGSRFHCLGMDLSWEAEEPPWVLLTDEEHRRVAGLSGPTPALEASYGAGELPSPGAAAPSELPVSPTRARMKAQEAFAKGDYATALRYLPQAANDGDHGLLARLMHIDTLRRVQRHDDARTLWSQTAEEWLTGTRRVWDTQWRELLALHKVLKMPADDPRLARIREKK